LDPKLSGEFDTCITPRWRFYDELHSLERFLGSRFLFPKKNRAKAKKKNKQREALSLLDVITRIVRTRQRDWINVEPYEFVKMIKKEFDDKIADRAYWWLCVAGFLQFQDIDQWWDSDQHWTYSVDYTKFAPRALAFLEKTAITVPR